MTLDQVERNLLLFLGAGEGVALRNGGTVSLAGGGRVFSFPRSRVLAYLFLSLRLRLGRQPAVLRRVLYLNEGLLSAIFDAEGTAGYRAFARRHLPRVRGMRGRLRRLLPLFLRADRRFIVTGGETGAESYRPDFMFYSNPEGKLMLTRAATFATGTGTLLKASASPEYGRNLAWEHRIVSLITSRLKPGYLPETQEKRTINGRDVFPEEYLAGRGLREILRDAGRDQRHGEALVLLDRLDAWFAGYLSGFSGDRVPLSVLLGPVLTTFNAVYGGDIISGKAATRAGGLLASLDRSHPGLVPVIAHNDLWPGNFIVAGTRLVAVDWERATLDSSPLFDYYWMIISAAMEYAVGAMGRQDYSAAFRLFLSGGDPVAGHAADLLHRFIDGLGFHADLRQSFLMLFLIAWSVQGRQALGTTTAMDRLAHGELVNFISGGEGNVLVPLAATNGVAA